MLQSQQEVRFAFILKVPVYYMVWFIILPTVRVFSIQATMQGDTLRVLSANCQGLRNYKIRRDVLDYFYSSPANIVCLQDTHWIDNDLQSIKQIWQLFCKWEQF